MSSYPEILSRCEGYVAIPTNEGTLSAVIIDGTITWLEVFDNFIPYRHLFHHPEVHKQMIFTNEHTMDRFQDDMVEAFNDDDMHTVMTMIRLYGDEDEELGHLLTYTRDRQIDLLDHLAKTHNIKSKRWRDIFFSSMELGSPAVTRYASKRFDVSKALKRASRENTFYYGMRSNFNLTPFLIENGIDLDKIIINIDGKPRKLLTIIRLQDPSAIFYLWIHGYNIAYSDNIRFRNYLARS